MFTGVTDSEEQCPPPPGQGIGRADVLPCLLPAAGLPGWGWVGVKQGLCKAVPGGAGQIDSGGRWAGVGW